MWNVYTWSIFKVQTLNRLLFAYSHACGKSPVFCGFKIYSQVEQPTSNSLTLLVYDTFFFQVSFKFI